jgi:hypothetical protein
MYKYIQISLICTFEIVEISKPIVNDFELPFFPQYKTKTVDKICRKLFHISQT